jgi:hypothetical protein
MAATKVALVQLKLERAYSDDAHTTVRVTQIVQSRMGFTEYGDGCGSTRSMAEAKQWRVWSTEQAALSLCQQLIINDPSESVLGKV